MVDKSYVFKAAVAGVLLSSVLEDKENVYPFIFQTQFFSFTALISNFAVKRRHPSEHNMRHGKSSQCRQQENHWACFRVLSPTLDLRSKGLKKTTFFELAPDTEHRDKTQSLTWNERLKVHGQQESNLF